MSGISFFTPIESRHQVISCGHCLTEIVDKYFYLGGKVAVIIPDHIRLGSQEVELQEKKVPWWEIALKVLSYVTLILPLLMLIAKAILRSYYAFHTCQWILPENYTQARAPLTLVRSDGLEDLNISVLYDQKFRPRNPIVPQPTEIRTEDPLSKYTWKILTHGDGTMTVEGLNERVNMIWWEAIRKEAPTHVDKNQAARVKRTELKPFLEETLRKMGVRDSEFNGFTEYWNELFQNDQNGGHSPDLLVQLIDPEEHHKYIPEMQVEGERANLFALRRFYFRFEPTSDLGKGLDPSLYLDRLRPSECGTNAVIDLGGEIADPADVKLDKNWEDSFNTSFTQRVVYA